MTDQAWFPDAYYQSSQLQPDRQETWAHEAARQQPILDVVQEPGRTRVTRSGRPKMRFNLDPPPVLRLRYTSTDERPATSRAVEHGNDHFKLNPRLFVIVSLLRAHEGAPSRDIISDGRLLGSSVASPHKLRNETETAACNLDFEDGPLFVFGDLSCTIEGRYKLEFNLYELNGDQLNFLISTMSKTFEVAAPKDCSRRRPATHLSLACHNQGVRLKIRKAEKRKRSPGSGDDADSGQETGDPQRHKFRRLMPNDQSLPPDLNRTVSSAYDSGLSTRDDARSQWIPSSRETSMQATPNPKSHLRTQQSYSLDPPSSANSRREYRKVASEYRGDLPPSTPHGRVFATPSTRYGPITHSNVAIGINHEYPAHQTSPHPVGLGLSTDSWIREHQSTPTQPLNTVPPATDTPIPSKRPYTQMYMPPQSAFTFQHPTQMVPHAVHSEDWDNLNLNIPSPTGGFVPLHTDSGFGGSVYEGWSTTSG